MKIKNIEVIEEETVYDLEIKDNHNFFANGILVHNCVRSLMKKLSKADKKQSDVDKWQKNVERFINGAIENGISKKDAESVADDLLRMSGYSFNRCFSGNNIIDRDNWKGKSPLTIKEMFLTMNDLEWAKKNNHLSLRKKYRKNGYGKCYSLNEDGRLRLNKIVNIYFQGIRKTYKITLENGKSIAVTSNHKFPIKTDNGIIEKTLDKGLKVGDKLIIKNSYEKNKNYNYSFSSYSKEERPFKKYEGEGFKSREENSAFINGEFLKYKENRTSILKEIDGICQICFTKNSRLECHHKDGNRLNNEEKNLIICCPSCHKKFHYLLGRTKIGENGLSINEMAIISIEELEEEEVFDVEMEHPYHTLSVNGIVASNSHAVAYTYTAVITLYLSYYFKPYFYSSTLTYEAEKQENLKKRLDNCRVAGFTVLPPDVNRSELHFFPEDNNIRFGLNEIKFVGEAPANTIIKNRPYSSLFNFFEKNMGEGINIRTTLALIRSGAFDNLINKDRKRYSFIYEQFNEKKKSTKVIEKLKFLWETIEKEANSLPGLETSETDLVEYEKEYFGFPIFSSLFSDKVIKFLIELNNRGLCELYFDEALVKPIIRIPVNVESYRTLIDKNGKEMAFLNCVDLSGVSKRLPIFQSYWKHVKQNFTGEGLYLVTIYADEEKDKEIYFGSKKWTDDATKSRMLKRLK